MELVYECSQVQHYLLGSHWWPVGATFLPARAGGEEAHTVLRLFLIPPQSHLMIRFSRLTRTISRMLPAASRAVGGSRRAQWPGSALDSAKPGKHSQQQSTATSEESMWMSIVAIPVMVLPVTYMAMSNPRMRTKCASHLDRSHPTP